MPLTTFLPCPHGSLCQRAQAALKPLFFALQVAHCWSTTLHPTRIPHVLPPKKVSGFFAYKYPGFDWVKPC